MRKINLFFTFILVLSCSTFERSVASSVLNISLHGGTPSEVKAKALLLNLESSFDLSPYIFTKDIKIRSRVIPHSHPVLTLNTRLIDNKVGFLSAFLHEQIHRFFSLKENKKGLSHFIHKMRLFYPNIPVGSGSGGAKTKYSSYLHLGVNLLEYEALREYVGEQEAANWFKMKKIYPWLNKEVLKSYLKIRQILDKNSLVIQHKHMGRVYQFLNNYDQYIAKRIRAFEQDPWDITNKNWVKGKLSFMVEIDQYMRNQTDVPHQHSYSDEERDYFWTEFAKRFSSLDSRNTKDLKKILKKYKWIKISEFGLQSDRDAWLIVQHADNYPEFQKEVLFILSTLWKSGETNKTNYAYLYDRVAASWSDLSKRKPQRYGTQGICKAPRKWEPIEIEDYQNVDKRRAEVGLGPLQDYIDGFKDICK